MSLYREIILKTSLSTNCAVKKYIKNCIHDHKNNQISFNLTLHQIVSQVKQKKKKECLCQVHQLISKQINIHFV